MLALAWTSVLPNVVSADSSANLQAWFAAQANIWTWSADFAQTRTLKALAQPLVSEGRLWFAAPNHFRWELGSPAQTIAVRKSNEVVVAYPQLRRAERYVLDDSARNPMRDMLSLLEAGFPRSQAELEKTFRIESVREEQGTLQLALVPRAAAARRWVEKVELELSTKDHSLRSSSLHFKDGSTLRNDYRNLKINPELPHELFATDIPSGYKVAEPGKERGK